MNDGDVEAARQPRGLPREVPGATCTASCASPFPDSGHARQPGASTTATILPVRPPPGRPIPCLEIPSCAGHLPVRLHEGAAGEHAFEVEPVRGSLKTCSKMPGSDGVNAPSGRRRPAPGKTPNRLRVETARQHPWNRLPSSASTSRSGASGIAAPPPKTVRSSGSHRHAAGLLPCSRRHHPACRSGGVRRCLSPMRGPSPAAYRPTGTMPRPCASWP